MWNGAEIDAAIAKHTPLVRTIAWHMLRRVPPSIEYDDLVQDGMIGLLEAATAFDPDRGVLFTSYATERIRGAMRDQMRESDWIPRSARAAQRSIDKASHQAAQKAGRTPTAGETAHELQMPVDALQRLIGRVHSAEMLSIEDLYHYGRDDDDASWLDHNAPDLSGEPFELLAEKQFQARVAGVMLTLNDRQRDVMRLLYVDDLNQQEAGERLGITESRVCQLRQSVVRKIRAEMGIAVQHVVELAT